MSIASELNNLEGNIEDSYDAVNDMGGVIPAQRNMDNLDQAIRTIPQNQGTTYTAGNGINIDANNEISIDTTVVAEVTDLPSDMTGATSSVAGTHGLVPAPTTADVDKYLKGDGTWATVQSGAEVKKFYIDSDYIFLSNGTVNQEILDAPGGNAVSDATLFAAMKDGLVMIIANWNGTDYESAIATNAWMDSGVLKFTIYGSSSVDNSIDAMQVSSTGGGYYDFDGYDIVPKNGTLTIQQNGSTVATFTADQATNTTANITTMTGATSSVAGAAGLVPAPTTSDPDKYLKGDGTWAKVGNSSIDWDNVNKALLTYQPTQIPNNSDLNTPAFLKVGTYYVGTNNSASTISNSPSTLAFKMEVTSHGPSIDDEATNPWVRRFRILTDINGNQWMQVAWAWGTAGVISYTVWNRINARTYHKGDTAALKGDAYVAGRQRVVGSSKYIIASYELDGDIGSDVTSITFSPTSYNEAFGASATIFSYENPSSAQLNVTCSKGTGAQKNAITVNAYVPSATLTNNACCTLKLYGTFTFS